MELLDSSATLTPDDTEGPLSAWQPGEEGVVIAVPGSSRLAFRLREMGLVPGARIRVLRTGNALVVQVGEGRLCLRKQDAAAIRVAPLLPVGLRVSGG